jgi:hypothetical protein
VKRGVYVSENVASSEKSKSVSYHTYKSVPCLRYDSIRANESSAHRTTLHCAPREIEAVISSLVMVGRTR